MLNALRSQSNSFIFKAFFGLLAFTFVAWGIGDFVTGSRNTTAIEVGDKEISVYTVDQLYRRTKSSVARSFGMQEIDDTTAAQIGVGKRVIQTLVRNAMIDNAAADLNLAISDKMLLESIQKDSNFTDANGEFDPETYKRLLQTIGMTPENFEKSMREDLLRATVNDLFLTSMFLNEDTVRREADIANEKITVETLALNADMLPKQPTVTAEEIQNYYNENPQVFMSQERRSVDILHLNPADLARKISIPAHDVEAYYNANLADFSTEEKRTAQHILVKTEDEANAIIQQLADGADFAAIAKEKSLDPGSKDKGGDLGEFAKGDMVEAFAKAAFSLEKDAVSAPVESPFGWHVIRVTNINHAQAKPLATVRADIEDRLKREQAEDMAYGLIETVEDAIAAGESLQAVAKANGLTVKGFDSITVQGLNAANTSVALPEQGRQEILDTAFTLDQGIVSNMVELPDNSSVFVLVRNIEPAAKKELATVRNDILKHLKGLKELRALNDLSRNIILKQEAGLSLRKAARANGIRTRTETFTDVSRSGENAPEWLNADFREQLFGIESGKMLRDAIKMNDTYHLVLVKSRLRQPADEELINTTRQNLGLAVARNMQTLFINQLQLEQPVKINRAMIRRVIPTETLPEAWFQ